MKYGFLEPVIDITHYVMGSIASLPTNVLQFDGQWDKFLPEGEEQKKKSETFNCTSFATLNCMEILLKKIYGKTLNKSDRQLGISAGTHPPGNDPHVVAEAARNKGVVPEEFLPYNFDIYTWEDYYSYLFGDKDTCDNEAKKFLSQYTFGHEWVFSANIQRETRIALMREALTYSPLGVSVSWLYEQDGVAIDIGLPNNHWTVVYGWNEKGWLCFDSYSPFKKVISYDHNIKYCKRYSLVPVQQKVSLWATIIKFLLSCFKKT